MKTLTQDHLDQIMRDGLSRCRDQAEAERLSKPVAASQAEQDARLTEYGRQIWQLKKALEADQLEHGRDHRSGYPATQNQDI